VEVNVSKKISALSIAVLVIAGTFVGISSAAAATAYKACKPLNSKATIGKISYTCTKNPASTSKSLVWVSAPCINANKSYLSAKSLADSVGSSFDGRISSTTRLKATNERLIASAQKNVDTWSKNMLSYPKNPTETQKKQIATVQAGIDRNKQRVIDATANIVELDAQIKEATDGKAKTVADLASAKTSLSTACK
jgi:beta-glucosidase/6-phospho-beta-glucosidase/beta-galactosidase